MTPPHSPARISIIITSWNTRTFLQQTLASLQRCVPPGLAEFIVVDNGSADGSAAMVASVFPEVRLLCNSRNEGFARANNQGYGISTGAFVLLLGSDTLMRERTVETMAAHLDAHPSSGAVSCRLLNPDGTPQMSCRRFPRLRDAVVTYLSLHRLARDYTYRDFDFARTQDVEQPAATCLMIRRSVIETTGLFDERYAILYNDVDLCRRIRAAGWSITYLGNAEIVHYGCISTNQATPEIRLEMYRNILRYFVAGHGWTARLVLTPILFARLLAVTRSRISFSLFSGNGGGLNP
jgi:hypothetical protein